VGAAEDEHLERLGALRPAQLFEQGDEVVGDIVLDRIDLQAAGMLPAAIIEHMVFIPVKTITREDGGVDDRVGMEQGGPAVFRPGCGGARIDIGDLAVDRAGQTMARLLEHINSARIARRRQLLRESIGITIGRDRARGRHHGEGARFPPVEMLQGAAHAGIDDPDHLEKKSGAVEKALDLPLAIGGGGVAGDDDRLDRLLVV